MKAIRSVGFLDIKYHFYDEDLAQIARLYRRKEITLSKMQKYF